MGLEVHFSGKYDHAIRQRQTQRFLPSLSLGLVNEISLQGAGWRYTIARERDHKTGLLREPGGNHPWSSVSRSRSYVCVSSTKPVGERPHAQDEGAIIAQGAARIPPAQKAVLGEALLGPRIFFDHERGHYRRYRTSVPRKARAKSYRRQSVVV